MLSYILLAIAAALGLLGVLSKREAGKPIPRSGQVIIALVSIAFLAGVLKQRASDKSAAASAKSAQAANDSLVRRLDSSAKQLVNTRELLAQQIHANLLLSLSRGYRVQEARFTLSVSGRANCAENQAAFLMGDAWRRQNPGDTVYMFVRPTGGTTFSYMFTSSDFGDLRKWTFERSGTRKLELPLATKGGLPPDADFARFRSPVSLEADHLFRLKPITRFAPSRSPISLEADQSERLMAIVA